METNRYTQKALNVIHVSRASGSTRGDIRNLLELEPINLAMMETFAQTGEDESRFNDIYQAMLPIARTRLIEETLEAYGLRTSLAVDYKKIVEDLLAIESSGGRKADEPRTVGGESLIIATLVAIANNPSEDLRSEIIQNSIENNYMIIFEKLIESLKNKAS